MNRPVTHRLILGIFLFAGSLFLRLFNLDWGFPGLFEEAISVTRAWEFWAWGRDGLDLNPNFFNYPSLYFYLQFIAQAILGFGGWLSGRFPDACTFQAAYYLHPQHFILTGRALSALFGAATVLVVYSTGVRAGGIRVGVPAALFLAFHSVHFHKCRFVEVDVPMTFFAALSFLLLYRYVLEGGRTRFLLAGCVIGLAAATKYPGAVFLLNLPLAAWLRRQAGGVRLTVVAILLAVLTFLAVSPYVLLDHGKFLEDIIEESHHMRVGHFGREGEGVMGAVRIFAEGFGPPILLLAAAALLLALLRPRSPVFLFVPLPVIYFLLLSLSRMQVPHYPLPVVPPLVLLAAFALGRWFTSRGTRVGIVLGVVVVLLLAVPAKRIIDKEMSIMRGDTRLDVCAFIEEKVPAGALVLMEPHGPQLTDMSEKQRWIEESEFRTIRGLLLESVPDRPAYRLATLTSYTIDVARSRLYYGYGPYQWFEYVVTTDWIRGRYREDPECYPVQNSFYDRLEEEFTLFALFSPGEGEGPEIRVYRNNEPRGKGDRIRLDPAGADDEVYLSFLRSVAFLYEWRGNRDASLALYRALLDLVPDDPQTLFQTGVLLAGGDDPGAGLPFLERSVAIDPENRKARKNLGILLCRAGRLEDGVYILDSLLREEEDPDVRRSLGSALAFLGREEEALEHFQVFLETAPDHPGVEEVRSLVRYFSSTGKREERPGRGR